MKRDEELGTDVEESGSRRKFLKTAGKFAVYTPPALMIMTSANAKKMAKSGGYKGDRKGPKREKEKKEKAKRDKRNKKEKAKRDKRNNKRKLARL